MSNLRLARGVGRYSLVDLLVAMLALTMAAALAPSLSDGSRSVLVPLGL